MNQRAQSGFTLIELLVTFSVIGILIALMLPAVNYVRRASRSTLCQNSIRQLAIGVLNYHQAYREFPLSSSAGWPKSTTWFGEVDFSTNKVNIRGGSLMPFLENNSQVLRCPEFDPDALEYLYEGKTGGYGYNQNLGTTLYPPPSYSPVEQFRRIRDFEQTTKTIMFTDAARIQLPWSGDPELKATENYYIQGPQDTQFFTAPGTHFRHTGFANVAFMDGHIESVSGPADVDFPVHWPSDARELAKLLRIGYVSEWNEGPLSNPHRYR